jgi:hypothetical protein
MLSNIQLTASTNQQLSLYFIIIRKQHRGKYTLHGYVYGFCAERHSPLQRTQKPVPPTCSGILEELKRYAVTVTRMPKTIRAHILYRFTQSFPA